MITVEMLKKVKAPTSKQLVSRVAEVVARVVSSRRAYQVSLALVGDMEIKRLNHFYRCKNKITDVLSFGAKQKDFILPDKNYLGEVVISYPQLCRQAKANKVSVKQEFVFLLAHGLLHLLGYDHERSLKEERRMFKKQDQILALVLAKK